MIRLVWSRLVSRKFVSFTIVLAFLAIYLLVPLGFQNKKEITLAVENTITNHGRGSYDILVRPSNTRTQVEKQLGFVEENYVGDSQGGISIEEWKEIQKNEAIEIAAPVASIGYFSGNQTALYLPQLPDSTMFTWEFYTSDGLKKYPLQKPQSLVYFKESTPGYMQYIKEYTVDDSMASGMAIEIMMPQTHHLLAAVDFETEQKLTNIDFSQINDIEDESYKSFVEFIRMQYGDVPIVKVLQRKDISVPLSMKLKVNTFQLDFQEYRKKYVTDENEPTFFTVAEDKKKEVFSELNEQQPSSSSEYEIDLSPYQNPFEATPISLTDQLEVEYTEDSTKSMFSLLIYYTAKKLQYKKVNDDILRVDIVENGMPPSYKEVEKKGKHIVEYRETGLPYVTRQFGTFEPIPSVENPLTSSPLGIYSTQEVKTEQGQVLNPTTIPGSFIPQPAGALISIEDAELIKGPKPIVAIRVRVGGVTKYDKAAEEKIEHVAKELLMAGYEVDIVAGSSFKNMNMDVEGIGKVTAPWTTLGVAQSLSTDWNYLAIVTTVLFVVFSIVWFVARLTFEKGILERENNLLYLLGWHRNKIILRNCMEQYMLLFLGYSISLPIMYYLHFETTSYVMATIIFVIGFIIITLLFTINKAKKIRTHAYKRMPTLFYYKNILIPTMMVLLISTILIVIQLSSLGDSIAKASETSLGQLTVKETFWLQVSIFVSTLILSILGLSECMNALMTARKTEFDMYKTIGWTKLRIFFHFLKEVFVWAGTSIFLGLIVGFVTLLSLKTAYEWILVGVVFAAVLLGLMIILIVMMKNLVKPLQS